MNIPQRIVLIISAVVFLVILATHEKQIVHPFGGPDQIKIVWNWQSALTRCVIVSGATTAIFFAVGKRKQ
jgi:hypothetical protein